MNQRAVYQASANLTASSVEGKLHVHGFEAKHDSQQTARSLLSGHAFRLSPDRGGRQRHSRYPLRLLLAQLLPEQFEVGRLFRCSRYINRVQGKKMFTDAESLTEVRYESSRYSTCGNGSRNPSRAPVRVHTHQNSPLFECQTFPSRIGPDRQ